MEANTKNRELAAVIALAEQLIALPSVSGSEAAILQFVADWMTKAGYDEVIQNSRWTAGVIRAAKPATRAVILCGHIDTVAPGDETAWQRSPWQPHQADGRLYGLGASDMKTGVALQMTTARDYMQTRRDDIDVWCVAVAHEEVDGAGSANFTNYFTSHTHYDDVSCVIAEPTDGAIEIGHRGNRFIELIFTGQAGHASQEAAYGRSALPQVVDFLRDIETVRHELHAAYTDDTLGQPSFTPTRISPEGSYSSNKTSGASVIAVDVRTTPALDKQFTDWANQLAAHHGCTWRYAADYVPSALCHHDARVLRTLQKLLPHARVDISAGATDQAFFQMIGAQTVIYGPGEFAQAHTIDESISLAHISASHKVYRRLLQVV